MDKLKILDYDKIKPVHMICHESDFYSYQIGDILKSCGFIIDSKIFKKHYVFGGRVNDIIIQNYNIIKGNGDNKSGTNMGHIVSTSIPNVTSYNNRNNRMMIEAGPGARNYIDIGSDCTGLNIYNFLKQSTVDIKFDFIAMKCTTAQFKELEQELHNTLHEVSLHGLFGGRYYGDGILSKLDGMRKLFFEDNDHLYFINNFSRGRIGLVGLNHEQVLHGYAQRASEKYNTIHTPSYCFDRTTLKDSLSGGFYEDFDKNKFLQICRRNHENLLSNIIG